VPDPHIQLYISLVAIILAAISLVDKFYGKSAQTQKELAQMREELASLKTKVEPFWNMIETHLPAMLKQPIHLKMDGLLDIYPTCKESMSMEQLNELEEELLKAKEEARMKKDPKMMGYVWMAAVVSSRIAEKKRTIRTREKKAHWYDWLRIP
jgi:hypothetical protein